MRQAPDALQSLTGQKPAVVLQAPGEDHFGPLLHGCLVSVCQFGMRLLSKVVHMHFIIRAFRLDGACEARDVDVFVQGLQEQLSLSCWPRGIRRNPRCSKGEQDLRDGHEHLLHADRVPLHAAHQAFAARHAFEKHPGQLPPLGFPSVVPVFLASQGFVLSDVQGQLVVARQLVHVALLENGLDVIPPCQIEGATNRANRSVRGSFRHEVVVAGSQIEPESVYL